MARHRPRPRALTQKQNGLAGIGLESYGRLGAALTARGGRTLEAGGAIDPTTSHIVVGARATDPATLVAKALAAGCSVLIEDPASFPRGQTNVALDHVSVAFTFRFEPAADAARASLQTGSVGLPFAATAEAIGPSRTGSTGLAIDLLDAILHVTGLSLESAARLSTDPCVISLLLSHGVVGDVSALATNVPDSEALAIVKVRGSQGSLEANLASPRVIAVSKQADTLRMGESGVARLLAAFCGGAPLPTLAEAVALSERIK